MVICPAIVGRLACFRVAVSRTLLAFCCSYGAGARREVCKKDTLGDGGFVGERTGWMIDDWIWGLSKEESQT